MSDEQAGEGGRGCRELSHMLEAGPGTPADSVDVDVDALEGHEGDAVVDTEQTDLSRRARSALSEHRQPGGPAAASRRTSGGRSNWKLELLLDAFEFGDRD